MTLFTDSHKWVRVRVRKLILIYMPQQGCPFPFQIILVFYEMDHVFVK